MFFYLSSSFKGDAREEGRSRKKGARKGAKPSKLSQLQKFKVLTVT
jgi:hypothetical protein